MKIKDIMTPHVKCIEPGISLTVAARVMRALGVGALPVCEDQRLLGMVTDRDITVRGVAEDRDLANTSVESIMTRDVIFAYVDQDVEEATLLMEIHQVRRLPVMDRSNQLMGIVSLGDLCVLGSIQLAGDALREISDPAQSSVVEKAYY